MSDELSPQQFGMRVQAAAQSLPLQVMGLEGLPTEFLRLESADGRWAIQVPRHAFPLDLKPGEAVVVHIGMAAFTIRTPDEPEKGKLILPGGPPIITQ